jgi:arabinosyltransferase
MAAVASTRGLYPVVNAASAGASSFRCRSSKIVAPFKSPRSPALQGQPLRLHSGRRQRLGAMILHAQWGADVAFTDAKILETGKAADNLHRCLVDIGSLASEYTIPGQFIQAKIAANGKAGFFAIASAPDSNNAGVVELLIKPNGEAAEAICAATEGATVKVSSVMGKGFPVERIPADSFKKVYLFATGSGISPIKALIESGKLNAGAREQVTLYYGTRTPAAMAFGDRLSQWEEEFGVKVVPVYSQEGQGYVQDVFLSQGGVSGGSEGVACILCGQKGMAEAVTEALTAAGVVKENILTNF